MRRCCTLGLVAFVFALTAGCYVPTTTAERETASASIVDRTIDGLSSQVFLERRSAWLIGGAEELTVGPQKGALYSISIKARHGISLGAAAAIDPRGYFLTASHVLKPGRNFAMYRDGEVLRGGEVRVVWRGDLTKGEPDLAVLDVGSPLSLTFEWSEEPKSLEQVLALGPVDLDAKVIDFSFLLLGGSVIRTDAGRDSQKSSVVRHTVPLREGDSGGPLTTRTGRLIGVNTEGHFTTHLLRIGPSRTERAGVAERPDLDWLRALIDSDAGRAR